MIDVRTTYADPLTEEKLFAWHRMLMKGNHRINADAWRKSKELMQVVSGAMGKEKSILKHRLLPVYLMR